MAKQLVGPVERHLEKAVVGLAGVLLVGVVVVYLVGSPNQMQLDGASEAVSPRNIDARVADKANAVRERIRTAQPRVEIPPPVFPEFASTLNPFAAGQLARALAAGAPRGPEAPIIDPPSVIEGDARLTEVLPLPKPTATFGRTTFELAMGDPQNPTVSYPECDWVTVSALFDRKQQEVLQAAAYGEARREVVFGPVELQRRAQRRDGSWSDEDWETIAPWPSVVLPEPPTISLEQRGKDTVVPIEDQSRVNRFYDQVAEPKNQLDLIRPFMPPRKNGNEWRFPTLTPYRELLLQDDDFLSPQAPAEIPYDRYGLDAAPAVTEEQPGATQPAGDPVELALNEAEALLKRAQTPGQCVDAYNMCVEAFSKPTATRAQKDRAQRIMQQADQKRADKEREERRGGPRGAVPGTPVEELPKREWQPRQQLWAHDASPGSLVPGKTYQYRMRVLLFNRRAGEPLLFRDKSNAQVIWVAGAWSEPTEPITIPPIMGYFLASSDERKEEVTIELFRWFEGIWVRGRGRFGIGQAMRHEERTAVPAWDDPNQVERPMVTFAVDGMIADINFKRDCREPRKAGKSGVKFPAAGTTTSVVVVDAEGNLRERFLSVDKIHPEIETFRKMLWSPPRQR